jgi:putative hydrolase of the HAD superfamily
MSLPRAILVDLDDTLIDDTSTVDGSWNDAFEHVAARLDGQEKDIVLGEVRKQSSWFWSDAERHRSGRLDLRSTTNTIVERAFAELGLTDSGLAHEMGEMYRDLREQRAQLFPGATETLKHLRTEGVKLGMMTNGAAAAQRAKIERYELAPYFDHIIIEGEFGTGKPDRRVFDTLLEALGADPADTWAIGDNLEFDVLAPMKLGIHGIWVDIGGEGCDGRPDRPDRIVAAFTEIVS